MGARAPNCYVNTTLRLVLLKTDGQSLLYMSKEEENKQRIVAFNCKLPIIISVSWQIMSEKVTARCSWTQVAGKQLSQLVPTRLYDEDVFVK